MPKIAVTPPVSIILIIDGLSPRYLSPYGCTWIDTSALNSLASNSVVFENVVADCSDPEIALSAVLYGQHPLSFCQGGVSIESFFSLAGDLVKRCLLSDDLNRIEEPFMALNFDEVIELPAAREFEALAQSATHIAETHLGHCFARISAELQGQDFPVLFVIHLTSLTRIWDAPVEMRAKFCEEDDPDPISDVIPPDDFSGDEESRPDEILGITRALAAQIECLDSCLEILWQELHELRLYDESLIALITPVAFPVGHHGIIGTAAGYLNSDCHEVPLMIKLPGPAGDFAWRDHGLIQPSSVLSLIGHLVFTGSMSESDLYQRVPPKAVLSISGALRAIRTDNWLLIQSRERSSLFVKPDDRWDANPVEDRCREIASSLVESIEQLTRILVDDK